jgi:hypothetical protein
VTRIPEFVSGIRAAIIHADKLVKKKGKWSCFGCVSGRVSGQGKAEVEGRLFDPGK